MYLHGWQVSSQESSPSEIRQVVCMNKAVIDPAVCQSAQIFNLLTVLDIFKQPEVYTADRRGRTVDEAGCYRHRET